MPLTSGTKIHLQGSLAQGEVFDTAFFVGHAPGLTQAQLQAAVTAVATFLGTGNWTGARSLLGSDSSYTQVKGYTYQTPPNAPAQLIAIAGVAGAAGTGLLACPDQVAVVASLRTALVTRSGRGRMYIPANGASLTAHQLTLAQTAALALSVQQLFAAAVAAFPVGLNPLVQIDSSIIGGALPVVRIIVDSRPDIQRRRANKQAVLFSTTQAI